MVEWFNFIASGASILSFFISIYVLFDVRRIRKDFLSRVRIPSLLEALESYASDMSRDLASFEESRQQMEIVLARCEPALRSLSPKLSGVERRDTRRLANTMKNFRTIRFWRQKRELDYDRAWALYIDLQQIIEGVKNLLKDEQWRR